MGGCWSHERKSSSRTKLTCSRASLLFPQLLTAVTGQVPDTQVLIVACGVAKLIVGELVETAKKLAKERGHEGPLRVEDFKRAHTLTLRDTQLPLHRRRQRLM